VLGVVVGRHLHLGADGLGHGVHEREEAVGRAAGDDLELARVAVLAERPQDVRGVAVREHAADAVELPDVELRDVLEPVVLASGAVDLLLGERDQPLEVALVALEQELVRHHGDERRRERHR
jgi:hypothetical protein